MWTRLVCGPLLITFCFGCQKSEVEKIEGDAPPPVASVVPGVCKGGGGAIDDALAKRFFPREAGSYCVDPNGQIRSYGQGTSGTLDEVCTQQFDGECEVYKSFGLKTVVTLRFVDGSGTPGAVAVALSEFDSEEGAFGFYTKRVVAGADPSTTRLETLEADGHAVVGSGISYLWRGHHVAELSYTNPQQAPDALRASAKVVLPTITRALKLPGTTTPPGAARFLPLDSRLPLGVEYVHTDVLGVAGAGGGAIGYYAKDDRRWRVVVVQRRDADSAKDVIKTFQKAPGYEKIKDAHDGVFSFSTRAGEGAPRIEWIMGLRGASIVGIGDEEFVSHSDADRAKHGLDRAAKLALLQAALSSPVASPDP